ncbi:arylsulfotransferase family protein [bacterium]|nr:arylsulfotransferase family protein [bacterium]MCI0603038.1 arylsulfotransferase family protein [bacterium]
MSRRTKILIAVLGLALLSSYVMFRMLQVSRAETNNQDLESLRALPYVQWNENTTNPGVRGVSLYSPDLSYRGYNIYTNDVNKVFLLDMRGKIVKTWHLPGKRHCEHAELLENGELLAVCEGQGLVKLDWDSRVLWESNLKIHHDVGVLPDGSFLVPDTGKAEKYGAYDVDFDWIVHVSPSGQILRYWSLYDKRGLIRQLHPPSPLDEGRRFRNPNFRLDYYHLNAIEILPDTRLGKRDQKFQAGNIMLCLRNVNLICIFDPSLSRIHWSWGAGKLDYPHDPTMLPNGNILVFDNGTHRRHSRVVEIEPVKKRIVWQYDGPSPEKFFSKWRGGAQRLANGNTLICDSELGRVIEITADEKVVWEFWNPEIKEGQRKRIYRFNRIEEEKLKPFLAK